MIGWIYAAKSFPDRQMVLQAHTRVHGLVRRRGRQSLLQLCHRTAWEPSLASSGKHSLADNRRQQAGEVAILKYSLPISKKSFVLFILLGCALSWLSLHVDSTLRPLLESQHRHILSTYRWCEYLLKSLPLILLLLVISIDIKHKEPHRSIAYIFGILLSITFIVIEAHNFATSIQD